MHTEDEEFYVFLRFADGDISQALMALDHIPLSAPEFVRLCLLKDAAISYCRPFKRSRGAIKKCLKLDDSFVPPSMIKLHNELLNLRDQVFAHTDIDVRSAVLHYWSRAPKPIFSIQFKGYDYPQFLTRTEEMRTLFNSVLALILNRQSTMETQFSISITRSTSVS
jgi:hypothetical protein